MDWEDYKTSVWQLNSLITEKRLGAALKHVDKLLEKSPGSVALLIKRATLLQLQDDDTQAASLADCRKSLGLAIELEPNSIEPYIELGNFEYAVADNAHAALGYFEKAISPAEAGLKAALIGMVKCQMELGRPSDASRTMERMKTIFPDDLEVLMLEDELKDR
jgi:tetratricopeptide (TPR) repeat protein